MDGRKEKLAESLKEDGRPAQQWYWDDWFSEFGLRLCSLSARGLWMDILGIMFKAEIRGTLTVNGKQVDNKALAKITNTNETEIKRLIKELEENDVFSRFDDGTIFSRRMYRESKRKEEISRIRSRAGKKGMRSRWKNPDNKKGGKDDNKKITKITASSSSSSSSPTSYDDDDSNKPPKITFDFEKKDFFYITDDDFAVWIDAYPACDIEQELKRMKAWLISNPKQKKKDYKRFINNWLSRVQDKGGSKSSNISHKSKRDLHIEEQRKRFLKDG